MLCLNTRTLYYKFENKIDLKRSIRLKDYAVAKGICTHSTKCIFFHFCYILFFQLRENT